MRSSISFAIAAVIMLAPLAARAVPGELAFAGRLSTAAGPVDGTVSVRFAIFDVATGGSPLWLEDHPTLAADAGLVLAQLGSATTLDSSIFDGGRRYLEIRIGIETLSPRLLLGTVPYAFHADTADTLGTLGPNDVQARVTGACPPDSSIRAIDPLGNVTCEADDDTTYAGAAPITVTGGAIGLAACSDGQIYKRVGGAWACAADADTATTYAASAPLSLSGTTFGLSACPATEILKSNGATWTCAADTDTNTTYTATSPLSMSGTTFGLQSCGAGQILKYTAGGWACTTETTYSVSAPLTMSGSTIGFTTCPSGYYFTYGASGWGCTNLQGLAPLTVTSGVVGLQTAGCTAGQVYKLIGGLWTCANDNDTDTNTTYSAGSGLALGGTTFSVDSTVVARKDSAAGSQNFDSGTVYIDYAANRLGVGNTTPSYPLDVVGVARAASFRFTGERPNTYVIPHVEFQSYDLTTTAPVLKTFDSVILSGTTAPVTATLFAPIHIPPGASTVDVACDLFDASSSALSYSIQVMHRIQSNTTATIMASQSGATAGSSTSIQTVTVAWPTVTVAEDTYYVSVQLTQSVIADTNLRFYGCRVHYASLEPAY